MTSPPPSRPRPARAVRGRVDGRRKPALNRDRIVEAALRIVDADGVDAVSMRRVAAEFDTGPASLYAHVADKDELLELVFERAMADLDLGDVTGLGWADLVRRWALATYATYRRHNDLARVSIGTIPLGTKTLDQSEALLRAMIGGGVPAQAAAYAIDRLALYIAADAYEGWVFGQRFGGHDPAARDRAHAWFTQVNEYFAALPAERYPTIVAHTRELMGDAHVDDSEARFEFGLELMIDGLRALARGSST